MERGTIIICNTMNKKMLYTTIVVECNERYVFQYLANIRFFYVFHKYLLKRTVPSIFEVCEIHLLTVGFIKIKETRALCLQYSLCNPKFSAKDRVLVILMGIKIVIN